MLRYLFIGLGIASAYIVWRIASMKIKFGVELENVSWRMFYAALVVENVLKSEGYEAIITSGADGTHSAQSKHYAENNESGMVEALDFRRWQIADLPSIVAKIKKKLGLNYDVVIESTHFHVEYDPKA